MSATVINLLVLRVSDIEKGADFYSALGIKFIKHSHGMGPEHYAAEIGTMVFELYPQTAEDASTKNTRIGFAVADAASTLRCLEERGAVVVFSTLKDSPWGLRAVLADPFGHRMELTEIRK